MGKWHAAVRDNQQYMHRAGKEEELNIAFWSGQDGCGTTSSMAAIASVCASAWHMKTILLQSRNQKSDLNQKLGTAWRTGTGCSAHQPEAEIQDMPKRGSLVTVRKGRMYYLPQEEYRKKRSYSDAFREGMCRLIRSAEQHSDITFTDCGSGDDALSEEILSRADAVVVNLTQERRNLDNYFQGRHVFGEHVIYLVNAYHPQSAYNRQNLNRIYRLGKEELAVIPHSQFFRHASDNGMTEYFVRRHIRCCGTDRQFYFMQELLHAAALIRRAAGLEIREGAKSR